MASDREPTAVCNAGRVRSFSQHRTTGCSQPCKDCPGDSHETGQGNYNQAATQAIEQCVAVPLLGIQCTGGIRINPLHLPRQALYVAR